MLGNCPSSSIRKRKLYHSHHLEVKIEEREGKSDYEMDKRVGDTCDPHAIEKILSFDPPSEGAKKGPIAGLHAGKEPSKAEIQECYESIEALAKNDLELC